VPGIVTQLNPAKASGFALHPQRAGYEVLVHLVQQKNILCSGLADKPPPSNRDNQSNCWFHFDLAGFEFSYLDLKSLTFVIGETDELLDVVRVKRKPKQSDSTPLVVEDLMLDKRRAWITGATYLDAEEAGVSDADIIELFYIDLLGRHADPGGLANYLSHRRDGSKSLADIRRDLVESAEYAARRKEVAWAPGAIFSQPIVMRSSAAAIAEDSVLAQQAAQVAATSGDGAAAAAPSKVVTRLTPRRVAGALHKPETLEIALQVDSELFGAGWYEVEHLDDAPFRWMAEQSVIFNPQPDMHCTLVALKLGGVYGAHAPMLDCYFDTVAAEVRVEAQGEGFLVSIVPPDGKPQRYTCLRIESRASGCPEAENLGTDPRVLSLNLVGARIAYGPAAAVESRRPEAAADAV